MDSQSWDGKISAFRLFKIKASGTGAFGDNPDERRSACRTVHTAPKDLPAKDEAQRR
ncbi:MAG: hypothetical protein V1844_03055 [Pseudomonadota bacterium]